MEREEARLGEASESAVSEQPERADAASASVSPEGPGAASPALFSSGSDKDQEESEENEGEKGRARKRARGNKVSSSEATDGDSSSDESLSDSGSESHAASLDLQHPKYAHGLAAEPLRFVAPSLLALLAARTSIKSEAEARDALKGLSAEDLASLEKRLARIERRGAKLRPLHALPDSKLLSLPEVSCFSSAVLEERKSPDQQDACKTETEGGASKNKEDAASPKTPDRASESAPLPAKSEGIVKQEGDTSKASVSPLKNVQAALKTVRSQHDQIKRLRPHDVVFGCLYTRLKKHFPERSDAALYDMAKSVCEIAKRQKRSDVLEALTGRLALSEMRRSKKTKPVSTSAQL